MVGRDCPVHRRLCPVIGRALDWAVHGREVPGSELFMREVMKADDKVQVGCRDDRARRDHGALNPPASSASALTASISGVIDELDLFDPVSSCA